MGVGYPLCDRVTLLEIAIGLLPVLQIRADHPEVMAGNRGRPVVAHPSAGVEGAFVVGESPGKISLDVGDHPEIGLDVTASLFVVAANLESLIVQGLGLLNFPTLEREAAERIQGLGGQDGLLSETGHLETPPTQLPRRLQIAAPVVQHTEPAQRLGHVSRIGIRLCGLEGGLVQLGGERNASFAIVSQSLLQ